MNVHREPALNVDEPDEDGNEVERRRIGAFGLVPRGARSRSGVEAELRLSGRGRLRFNS